jgi:hypothetical protein
MIARKLLTVMLYYIEPLNILRILSNTALAALKDFYADRDAREKQFEDLKAGVAEPANGQSSLTMDAFTEDWNASQFWVS